MENGAEQCGRVYQEKEKKEKIEKKEHEGFFDGIYDGMGKLSSYTMS